MRRAPVLWGGLRGLRQVLYAGEPEYASKTQEVVVLILQELDATMAALGEKTDAASGRVLASTALGFFETALACAELTPATVSLASKLFGLACKSDYADKARLRGIHRHVSLLAKARGGAHEELRLKLSKVMPPK